ncbi:MAG: hypothetical protein AAEJ04_00435, partial [Planctomycetota bacterium]
VKPKRPVRKRSTVNSGTAQKKATRSGPQKKASAVAPDGTLLQQALIELLIEKGVISADEWNARVRLVARRSSRNR